MFLSGIADEAGKDIDTQIRAHRELGWEYIELRNIDGTNLTAVTDEKFEEISEKLSQAGLKVSCLASGLCNWSRKITEPFDDDREQLARAIPRMQRLGTPFIRIMSYCNDGLSQSQWKAETVKRIRELAGMADDGGITLVHENCSGWAGQSAKHTLEFLQAIDSPALKLLYDTGNPVFYGYDAWDFYRQTAEHTVYVHIKDGIKKAYRAEACFPGEGDNQVERVLADLLSRGYDGGFSIEPHMKSVVHLGKEASEPASAYSLYVAYGRALMALLDKVRGQ